MDRPTCRTCEYREYEKCRRHPPAYVGETNDYNSYSEWPEVASDDWCGEHPDFTAYLVSRREPAPCEPEAPGAK